MSGADVLSKKTYLELINFFPEFILEGSDNFDSVSGYTVEYDPYLHEIAKFNISNPMSFTKKMDGILEVQNALKKYEIRFEDWGKFLVVYGGDYCLCYGDYSLAYELNNARWSTKIAGAFSYYDIPLMFKARSNNLQNSSYDSTNKDLEKAQEEIELLKGEIELLKEDVKKLKQVNQANQRNKSKNTQKSEEAKRLEEAKKVEAKKVEEAKKLKKKKNRRKYYIIKANQEKKAKEAEEAKAQEMKSDFELIKEVCLTLKDDIRNLRKENEILMTKSHNLGIKNFKKNAKTPESEYEDERTTPESDGYINIDSELKVLKIN
ncbi:hypothetical protein B5S28_g843 [[Candida] boidinii]|nr:hypothetical protein B5S28_g843 [[Candida] boidinii]OWB61172.1 hypothetical protein B5S29_g2057 [[Candida] boidinii]